MCTAISYTAGGHYFGRTLDHTFSYGQQVVTTPRNFPLHFRSGQVLAHHHAITGMALVEKGYPLYFDAMNEKGLAIAGLNFVGNAHYFPPEHRKDNIAHFELIPWLLGQCATVAEAKKLLQNLNVTATPFSDALPPAQLHWLLADRDGAICIESTRAGLHIYPDPVGVLTNNPPFPQQLDRLQEFMQLSPHYPKNALCPKIPLHPDSHGMGALGLPGDLSSRSRFVRAAFTKSNALETEDGVNQFFHIMAAVSQVKGCCRLDDGSLEYTVYTACCDTSRGIYYYTTYENPTPVAIAPDDRDFPGSSLIVH